jgi:hypothetical protein
MRSANFDNKNIVTLNLFQGPSILFRSALAARWMLKQVQHDEAREVV